MLAVPRSGDAGIHAPLVKRLSSQVSFEFSFSLNYSKPVYTFRTFYFLRAIVAPILAPRTLHLKGMHRQNISCYPSKRSSRMVSYT